MTAPPTDIGAYFLDLEQLLGRMEQCVTHYQVLEIDLSASTDEVTAAYWRVMRMLPKARGIQLDIPGLTGRVDRAVERLAEAYAVLSHFGRRTEYDNLLRPRRVPTPLGPPPQ